MQIATQRIVRKKGGKWRFRGLSAAAAALQVSRGHLSRVCAGKRTGKKLLARVEQEFPALLKGNGQASNRPKTHIKQTQSTAIL